MPPLLALTRAETAIRLGIGAAVALAAWFVLLGALAVATRARRPDPGPETLDLPGDEPPAVVCLLADGWEVGQEAVPATLIDLAARKVVLIESIGLDRFVVRLRPDARPQLTPYERQVLDHVTRLAAADGTVACEALTTGPEEESKNWWNRFEAAVVDDARGRGLSRPRWSRWMLGLLGAAALVPALLAAGAVIAAPTEDSSNETEDQVGAYIGLLAMFWVPLMAVPRKLRAERDTPAGREVAGKWLGLREHLEGSGGFEDAPPAAVAVWDRHLAYGAALGVAAGAVRALPLGSESDKVAWSHMTGHWRMVRIDYPKRIPPGWGRHPGLATAIGLATLLAGVLVARIFFPPMADAAADLLESNRDGGLDTVDFVGIALLAIPTVATTVWLLRAVLMLAAAVPDLVEKEEVAGVVLRIRPHEKAPYLAVDDGRGPKVRAWLVAPPLLYGAGLTQGAKVWATVTPRLGHVSKLANSPGATAPV